MPEREVDPLPHMEAAVAFTPSEAIPFVDHGSSVQPTPSVDIESRVDVFASPSPERAPEPFPLGSLHGTLGRIQHFTRQQIRRKVSQESLVDGPADLALRWLTESDFEQPVIEERLAKFAG